MAIDELAFVQRYGGQPTGEEYIERKRRFQCGFLYLGKELGVMSGQRLKACRLRASRMTR